MIVGYLGVVSRPGEDLVAELMSQLRGLALEKMMELEAMLARKKREEGRAEIVLELLGLKFGELDERTVARVRGGSEAELDLWAERVLTASALSEIFA